MPWRPPRRAGRVFRDTGRMACTGFSYLSFHGSVSMLRNLYIERRVARPVPRTAMEYRDDVHYKGAVEMAATTLRGRIRVGRQGFNGVQSATRRMASSTAAP